MDDVARRVDLDPDRVVAAGFSSGGMLTWTLACGMSDAFAGFIPVSGTFWAPVPKTCATPVSNIVHIHGTEDRTVPLGGRAIAEAKQGDVPETLAMYAAYGGFTLEGRAAGPADMTCETSHNPAGNILEFCTFPGGHSFSLERLRYAYERLMGLD
jgi:polyhydroxybutyrate depolymerase